LYAIDLATLGFSNSKVSTNNNKPLVSANSEKISSVEGGGAAAGHLNFLTNYLTIANYVTHT